jgi:hypothetical protein
LIAFKVMNTQENHDLHKKAVLSQKQIELGHDLGDWFIFRETRHFGPLTSKQVNKFLQSSLLSLSHHIWRPGFKTWVSIKEIETFRACGKPEIEFITDNDFSYQAQLGPIDRIKFQDTEMSFQEQGVSRSLNIKLTTEVTDKYNNLKNYSVGIYDRVLDGLGVGESSKVYWNRGLAMVSVLVLAITLGWALKTPGYESFIYKLSDSDRLRLVSNAKQEVTTKNPKLIVLEKFKGLKDPVLVGSVNLPEGSSLEIKIQGKPDTLLGTYRFEKTMNLTLKGPYFQTEEIRGLSGEYISPGEYLVDVTCQSCDKENLVLSQTVFKFGISNQGLYQKDLKSFHQRTRDTASVELDELRDLHDTLLDQFQKSQSIYNRSIGSKTISSWNQFAVSWLATQNKIVEMFEQVQADGFSSKIYYLSIYEAYGLMTRMIFELHVLQDKYLTNTGKSIELAQRVNELSQNIKHKMTYLKSQTDLMRVNLADSKGVPSMEGLNLNKF